MSMAPDNLELFEVDLQSWVPVEEDWRLTVPTGTYARVRYNIADFPVPVEQGFSTKRRLQANDSLHLSLDTNVMGKNFHWDLEIYVSGPPERNTVQVRFNATEINKPHFIKALNPDLQFGHLELDPFEIVLTFSEDITAEPDPTIVDGFAVYIKSNNCEMIEHSEEWEQFMLIFAPCPGSPGEPNHAWSRYAWRSGMTYTVFVGKETGLKALVGMDSFKSDIASARKKAATKVACLNDTDGDGDCHLCRHLPDGCFNKPPEFIFNLPRVEVKTPPMFDFELPPIKFTDVIGP